MTDSKLFAKDISVLAETFGITRSGHCQHLQDWMNATGALNADDLKLFDRVFESAREDLNYWNEEELKIRLVGMLFLLANIEVRRTISVFYERSLAARVGEYDLAVVADCLVATPTQFSKPRKPYFFLQEYKKGRGDDKDPECQMLMAMLIAREINQDNRPLYGSFLFGSHWRFTTLIGGNYCVSHEFNADERDELLRIVMILRQLRELIMTGSGPENSRAGSPA